MSFTSLEDMFFIACRDGKVDDSGVVLQAHRDHILVRSESTGISRIVPVTHCKEWEFISNESDWQSRLSELQTAVCSSQKVKP